MFERRNNYDLWEALFGANPARRQSFNGRRDIVSVSSGRRPGSKTLGSHANLEGRSDGRFLNSTRTRNVCVAAFAVVLSMVLPTSNAAAQEHFSWIAPANNEAPLSLVYLHAGDQYVIDSADGVATFSSGGKPWWSKVFVQPLVKAGEWGASALCGTPACGELVGGAGSAIPIPTNRKPRRVDNVPVDPHRKEGGAYTIAPGGAEIWVYQHLDASAQNRVFTANSEGWLTIKIHDQAGMYGDNEGFYVGTLVVYRRE
jgi:hypothetical protein